MSDTRIIDAVRKMAGTYNKELSVMVVAEVVSVDMATRSCVCNPLSGGGSSYLTGVQLMAEVDDGFLLVPAIGSAVIVCYSPRSVPYIALFSAIEKISLFTASGIQLQGGELGGLVIAQSLTARLNLIENAFNTLITKVNALAPTSAIPPLAQTTAAQIENETITHGKSNGG